MKALLVVLMLGWAGGGYAQAVYKWVDGQGITHYSSKPPAKGTKYSTIAVAPPPRRTSAAPAASTPAAALSPSNARAPALSPPPPQAPSSGPRSASCAEAKAKLDVMEAAPSMTTTDATTGSAREMNFQERKQAIVNQVQVVTRACRR